MKRLHQTRYLSNISKPCGDFGRCHKFLAAALTFQDSHISATIQSIFVTEYGPYFDKLKVTSKFSCDVQLVNISCTTTKLVTIQLQLQSDQPISENDQYFAELLDEWIAYCADHPDARLLQYLNSLEDQRFLRDLLNQSDGIAFVCNGSFLPNTSTKRYSSYDLKQFAKNGSLSASSSSSFASLSNITTTDDCIAFQSPPSMAIEFILPNKGKIKGMLIPKGVVVIVGGGYHGKSTLLNALKMGVYDKEPMDGCEFVISRKRTFSVRAEEGRYVGGIDISPFINSLPTHAKVDPSVFRTNHASGSTSMAANLIEILEIVSTEEEPAVLLLDEDICANNFMVRDSRMRSLVAHEPITPFSYRVNGLYKAFDISSVIVVGGSGDWFDVQTCTILMDNYHAQDVTKKAYSISHAFCNGRVQYNGRGLVHQLPWPTSESAAAMLTSPRYLQAKSIRNVLGIYRLTGDTEHTNYDPNYIICVDSVSVHCAVQSITWSSDFKRIHFHIASHTWTADQSLSTNEDDVMNKSKTKNSDRDVVIDMSACDQMIASKENVMGLSFALLCCFIYITSILLDEELIPISQFVNAYHKLVDMAPSIDYIQLSNEQNHKITDIDTRGITSIVKFVNERINNLYETDCEPRISEIFHQSDVNFILALNRIRGLKFDYPDKY